MQLGAGRADDDGRLLAHDDGARMQQLAVAVGIGAAVGDFAADGVDAVAVGRAFADGVADGVQAAGRLFADQRVEQAPAEALQHTAAQFRIEVVMHQVHRAGDEEARCVATARRIRLRLAA
ncbi:hypothetical protein D3C72_1220680 [compost metagenome]